MKKRVNIITVVVLMALTGLVSFVVTSYSEQEKFNSKLELFGKWQNEWRPFTDALNHIEKRYIGEIEQSALMEGAIEGLVRSTGDEWSRYLNPQENETYLHALVNSYEGIGVNVTRDGGKLKILEVLEDSPAEDAGLLTGDLITHVDGMAVGEIGYELALAFIRGGDVTVPVVLKLERQGAGSIEKSILRDTIVRPRIKAARHGTVGIIRILNFYHGMDDELIGEIEDMMADGITSLVFDVRNNPGGGLDVLESALDYLLPAGPLITLRDKAGNEDVRTSGSAHITLPAAVIINENSISAAEFFAACLQEYDRAVIVGEKTGGKGRAQENLMLNDRSGLILSTSEYFTSQGKSLDGTGVTPDVEVTLPQERRAYIGSMDPGLDRQLERALSELSKR
jgi:carboxyl-terminal processing protease